MKQRQQFAIRVNLISILPSKPSFNMNATYTRNRSIDVFAINIISMNPFLQSISNPLISIRIRTRAFMWAIQSKYAWGRVSHLGWPQQSTLLKIGSNHTNLLWSQETLFFSVQVEMNCDKIVDIFEYSIVINSDHTHELFSMGVIIFLEWLEHHWIILYSWNKCPNLKSPLNSLHPPRIYSNPSRFVVNIGSGKVLMHDYIHHTDHW